MDGEVTYQGNPVENGFVSLLPKDGLSTTAGGAIKNGKYRIANLQPGERNARISITFPHPPIEGSGDLSKIVIQPALIPPDAGGNSRTVQIKAGTQRVNFHLTH